MGVMFVAQLGGNFDEVMELFLLPQQHAAKKLYKPMRNSKRSE